MEMVAPRRKKIDGRWYDFYEGFEYKADAIRRAIGLRSGAYNVRIIRIPNIRGYFLYLHVKSLTDRRSR